jgi:hypothetical protein
MGIENDVCGYDGFGLGIEICVDGPVGNGKKARLEVWTNSSELASQQMIGAVNNWDGSAVNFPNWAEYGTAASCEIVSSNLRVRQSNKNDNEVTVTVMVELDDCNYNGSDSPYARCGGEGPHILETTTTVTMSNSPVCSEGNFTL